MPTLPRLYGISGSRALRALWGIEETGIAYEHVPVSYGADSKGADYLAQKMIAAAREAGVPVLRDIPLARSLYELSLGEEIPEDLYDAVAAILHVAWQEREASEGRGGLPDEEPSAP